MLESFRSFFQRAMTPPPEAELETEDISSTPPPLQVAACALLLEVAYADDEFADSERSHLRGALSRHFDLDDQTVDELIGFAESERRRAVDLFQFTSLIAQEYDESQKLLLLETLWGVVYADGEVARHEEYLMRKVSKLLDVRPGFLSEARRRHARRHGDGG